MTRPAARPRVLALVGATATGKTAVAAAAAARLGGEIVCADSRQVYRELDLGTGKPDAAQRAAVPHHLFEALELDERASAGWYARVAAAAVAGVLERGKWPVLVGGSGLYVRALMHGLAEEPPHDASRRARLAEEARTLGAPELHRRLAAVDPETAGRLDPNDAQRVTRALEVWESSGRPLSWWHGHAPQAPLAADWRVLELTLAPADAAARIAARTRAMFDGGLIEETRALLASGRGDDLTRLRAIGYDEAADQLAGRATRAEAEERTNLRTRQLGKRQRTWFRHQIEALRVDAASATTDALAARAVAHALAPADATGG